MKIRFDCKTKKKFGNREYDKFRRFYRECKDINDIVDFLLTHDNMKLDEIGYRTLVKMGLWTSFCHKYAYMVNRRESHAV